MTRALVLGGGGPVGIGWEAGLLVGLARGGVDPTAADAVIGTSAGSVVGCTLASGGDLTQATTLVEGGDAIAGDDPAVAAAGQGLEQLMATVAQAAGDPAQAETLRAGLGQLALAATTIGEAEWLETFSFFAGTPWPDGFSCTAVDVATGRFKVWTAADGVDVQHAVASSCAVPCIFPPVTIAGTRWMDGGVRDMLNADAASGHEIVLAVSCTLLELPPEFSTPAFDAVFRATRAQLDHLREGGAKVETIVPGAEMLEVSGWGLELMNFGRTAAAYEAGVRQGEEEAARISGFWTAA